jgi:hypothetical protein
MDTRTGARLRLRLFIVRRPFTTRPRPSFTIGPEWSLRRRRELPLTSELVAVGTDDNERGPRNRRKSMESGVDFSAPDYFLNSEESADEPVGAQRHDHDGDTADSASKVPGITVESPQNGQEDDRDSDLSKFNAEIKGEERNGHACR